MILSVSEIRAWDEYTIAKEGKSSLALMQNAALALAKYLIKHYPLQEFCFFCGSGNNAGDGVLAALMLKRVGLKTTVYLVDESKKGSQEFAHWLALYTLEGGTTGAPESKPNVVWVDALFGSGLNRPIKGKYKDAVVLFNEGKAKKVAIDIPSGMLADDWLQDTAAPIIKCDATISFQCFKWAFCNPENAIYTGRIHVSEIGLSKKFVPQKLMGSLVNKNYFNDLSIPKRSWNVEKKDFGKILCIGGRFGMVGSIVFAAKAAMCSGAGLVEIFGPTDGSEVVQSLAPEVIFRQEAHKEKLKLEDYATLIIGPGLGHDKKAKDLLLWVFKEYTGNLILDADALNTIAKYQLEDLVPQNAILTPHKREFNRMFGVASDQYQRLETQKFKAKQLQSFILYKGHQSCLVGPNGKFWINNSGNPALASGGSGDVLCGIIAGLISTQLPLAQALVKAIYLHGCLGDIFIEENFEGALTPQDLINLIPAAIKAEFQDH